MLPAAIVRDDEEERPPAPAVSMLPIENNLVAAVRALEAAKAQCDHALLLLQWAPRNADEVFRSLGSLQTGINNAFNAYGGYQEILSCKGQA